MRVAKARNVVLQISEIPAFAAECLRVQRVVWIGNVVLWCPWRCWNVRGSRSATRIRGSSTEGGTLRLTVPAHATDLAAALPLRALVRADTGRPQRGIGFRARRSGGFRSFEGSPKHPRVVEMPVAALNAIPTLRQSGTLRFNRRGGPGRARWSDDRAPAGSGPRSGCPPPIPASESQSAGAVVWASRPPDGRSVLDASSEGLAGMSGIPMPSPDTLQEHVRTTA